MADGPVYQIVAWDRLYENSRSRSLEKVRWVKASNNLGDENYEWLVSPGGLKGAAYYGLWRAMLAIASLCDPRGTFLHPDGSPMTVAVIGHKTRMCPSPAFLKDLFGRLETIGWIRKCETAETAKRLAGAEPALGPNQQGPETVT